MEAVCFLKAPKSSTDAVCCLVSLWCLAPPAGWPWNSTRRDVTTSPIRTEERQTRTTVWAPKGHVI